MANLSPKVPLSAAPFQCVKNEPPSSESQPARSQRAGLGGHVQPTLGRGAVLVASHHALISERWMAILARLPSVRVNDLSAPYSPDFISDEI